MCLLWPGRCGIVYCDNQIYKYFLWNLSVQGRGGYEDKLRKAISTEK
jgi:hypothetical protein